MAIAMLLSIPSMPTFAAELTDRNVNLRGSLNNCRIQFETDKSGHVAFMGGSITEMNGYRPLVCHWLQKRFPETKFTFTDAGISSTCSTTGAMRLQRDVLSQGPVDLFLVEFAVNDDQDAAHARRDCIRGMEGIVAQIRRHNPKADIVIVYFCNPGMVAKFQAGDVPVSVAAHEAVAEHHGVSTVNLAKEVAQQITAEQLTWKQFGGTHPGPAGNRLAADMVALLLENSWKQERKQIPHETPEKLLDDNSYTSGRLLSFDGVEFDDAWKLEAPDWKSLPGNCRPRFLMENLLHADKPGAELTLKFTGRAIGAYVLAGPDAGAVETSIDGGDFHSTGLYHRFSTGLHYPRTVMFHTDLTDGEHTLRLRVHRATDARSRGHAVRVLGFTAN